MLHHPPVVLGALPGRVLRQAVTLLGELPGRLLPAPVGLPLLLGLFLAPFPAAYLLGGQPGTGVAERGQHREALPEPLPNLGGHVDVLVLPDLVHHPSLVWALPGAARRGGPALTSTIAVRG